MAIRWLYLLSLVVMPGAALAADPFQPIHQPPPCSAAINRGAQVALDDASLQVKMKRTLSLNDMHAGRIPWVDENTFRFEHDMAMFAKVAELTRFAQERYNCTPLLLRPFA